ncbi:MAG: hypothetical protein QM802_04100 [Agriterribacter sp.]
MKKNISQLNKPYHLLLLIGILFFISGILCGNSTMGLHLNGGNLAFPYAIYAWLCTGILIGFWIIYLLTYRFLFSKKLIWIHILLTVIACLIPMLLPYIHLSTSDGFAGMPRRYYDFEGMDSLSLLQTGLNLFTRYFILFPVAALVYLLNLALGIYKMVANKKMPM